MQDLPIKSVLFRDTFPVSSSSNIKLGRGCVKTYNIVFVGTFFRHVSSLVTYEPQSVKISLNDI